MPCCCLHAQAGPAWVEQSEIKATASYVSSLITCPPPGNRNPIFAMQPSLWAHAHQDQRTMTSPAALAPDASVSVHVETQTRLQYSQRSLPLQLSAQQWSSQNVSLAHLATGARKSVHVREHKHENGASCSRSEQNERTHHTYCFITIP
eukprot:1151362-Pelagomonas_calceolata.AAC.5